jgi:hypothetical protein
MCVAVEMTPVHTIPGVGGGRIIENDGGGEINYYIFDTF